MGPRQRDAHLQIFQIGRLIHDVLAGEIVAALFEHLASVVPDAAIQRVGSLHGQVLSGWRHEVLQRSASCRAGRPSTLDVILAGFVVLVEDADLRIVLQQAAAKASRMWWPSTFRW
jgi:hypothetical protein